MSTTNNKPIVTLRDGLMKASIWRNTSEKGHFYSVDFIRSYQDEQDQWHDSHSFSGTELLQLQRLAGLAYDRIAMLRRQDAEEQKQARESA